MHYNMGSDLFVSRGGKVVPLATKSYVALTPLLAHLNIQTDPRGLFRIAKRIVSFYVDIHDYVLINVSVSTVHVYWAFSRI